jgi:ABC-type Zn uptake system ZnuABC Zn-binding protein ZnuA
LLVRVGLDHEPWLRRALATVGDGGPTPGGPRDLDASRGVALLQTETPRLRDDRATPHLHGFGNPHYWLDPENARPITAAIQGALARLSPSDRERFEDNRRRFLERLGTGLARWRAALAPWRDARLVAMHDTWPYFAARFGLTIAATVEPTPGVPPSPAALGALVEQMRAAGVRVLVAEPYASAALVRQVADKSGGRAVTLVPSVGGDAAAGDYVALFDLNVRRLADALAAAR